MLRKLRHIILCISNIHSIMKVFVAGGSGLVGRCLVDLLKREGIEYVSTYNSRPVENGYRINFEDATEIERLLDETQATVCVNCIVQRQTDICEKNWGETSSINIALVDTLSRVCNAKGVHLIHISTDYVFDGKKGPYYPTTETNPLQNYGISKLISEKRVIANTGAYTILRVPVLYWDKIPTLDENAVTLIGKKVLNQVERTAEDNYSIRRPVYIPDMCVFILDKIRSRNVGIFHFYNPVDAMTKYEIAKSIAGFLGKSHSHIIPSGTSVNMANRPYDTQLRDDSYAISDYRFLPLMTGIEKSFSRWKHPNPMKVVDASNCFLMMDLDGTLLETDRLHYEAYKTALHEFGIQLEWSEFEEAIHSGSIDAMCSKVGLAPAEYRRVRELKLAAMLEQTTIQPIEGASEFVEACLKGGATIVVVTNTSRRVVEHFKEHVPFLNRIVNWICREDYVESKPSSECYRVALDRFYTNQAFKIGFENTLNGYSALKDCVDCAYYITDTGSANYRRMLKEDCYLVRDFTHFSQSA